MVKVTLREYHGNLNENLNEWLFHVERMFALENVTDRKRRAIIMTSALRGTASAWAQSQEMKTLDDYTRLCSAMK